MNMEEFERPPCPAQHRVTGANSWLQRGEKRVCHEFRASGRSSKCPFPAQPSMVPRVRSRWQPWKAEPKGWPGGRDDRGPTPSAPARPRKPLASASKEEERAECALISTSIAEDCEASVCGVAREREREQPSWKRRITCAIISTSSGRGLRGPCVQCCRSRGRPGLGPRRSKRRACGHDFHQHLGRL